MLFRTAMTMLLLVALAPSAGLAGCGSGSSVSGEAYREARDGLVDWVITELIIPTQEDYDVFGDSRPLMQIVTLYTDESVDEKDRDDTVPDEEGIEKIIVLENGIRREITPEELEELTRATEYDFSNPDLQAGYEFLSTNYSYSFHDIMIYKLDLAEGEATVEVGNTFGPLWGYGILYHLVRDGDGWKVKSRKDTWIS
jgi:hypothetical protein